MRELQQQREPKEGTSSDAPARQRDECGWRRTGDSAGVEPSCACAASAAPIAPIEALYKSQAAGLVRRLSKFAQREEALDLVQELFCRLLRLGDERVAGLDRPEAYLSRMAENLVRDRAKSTRRRSDHLHVCSDDEDLVGPDQQGLLESRDMLNRLEQAMLCLRPKTREIFMAHRLDGLSYAEIAERTGLSIKGVEKQMSKAIAQIDRMLDRD